MSIQVPAEHLGDATVGSPGLALAAVSAAGDRRTSGGKRRRESTIRRLLVVTDALALTLAYAVIEVAGGLHGGTTGWILPDITLLGFGIPVWILLAHAHNLYHADSRKADHGWTEELAPILQLATVWSWIILLGISATGIRPVTLPKLALFWALIIVLLLALRSATRVVARRRPWYLQTALVVGPALEAAAVARRVRRHPEYRIDVVACVDTECGIPLGHAAEQDVARMIGPIPLIRGDVELAQLLGDSDVDRVIFAPGAKEPRGGAEALCALSGFEIHIDLIPSWSEVVGRRLEFHELEGMPLLSVPRTEMRRSDQRRKRAFDVLLTSLALLVLSPVLALCALAVKLDSEGPVLFRQRRVGRNNRRFEVLKFRSMWSDADARKEQVAALNFHGGGNVHGMFKVREDPRVTRVGRFLRRTSLDELPQLVNVLKGDMSIVGPRPLIENEDRQVEGRFRQRLASSPGLTGLWQIHGRSEIPFEEMVTLDCFYVMNWSLWGDVKLILRTVHAVLLGRGAY